MVLRLLSASTAQSVASQSTPFADIPILSAAVPRKSATRVAVMSADLKPTRLDAPGSADATFSISSSLLPHGNACGAIGTWRVLRAMGRAGWNPRRPVKADLLWWGA